MRKHLIAIYSPSMARPKMIDEPTAIAFRFPTALLAAVDATVERVNSENPHGPRRTRADLVRECVSRGLLQWFPSPDSETTRAA